MRFITVVFALLLVSVGALGAQETTATTVSLEPAQEVRYPEEKHLLNPRNSSEKPAPPFPALTPKTAVADSAARWYAQARFVGTEDQVVAWIQAAQTEWKAQGLPGTFAFAATDDPGRWLIWVGALQDASLPQVLARLSGLSVQLVRR